jgi:hypothetical protein
MNIRIRALVVSACFAVLILGGCAVHRDDRGKYIFSADNAQLFGEKVDERSLPDGNTITLRKLDNQWSLKFGRTFRVATLGKLAGAKIMHVDKIGEDVNVLL